MLKLTWVNWHMKNSKSHLGNLISQKDAELGFVHQDWNAFISFSVLSETELLLGLA